MAAMTSIMLATMAASTAMSIASQQSAAHSSAKAQEQQGTAAATEQHINAALTKLDGERIGKSATIEADKIRETAIAMRGQQESVQATSGALVGTGSGLVMTEDTTKRAEADALATVIDGIYGTVNKNAAARYQDTAASNSAKSAATSANSSLLAGDMGSLSTLANGVSSGLGAYMSFNKK